MLEPELGRVRTDDDEAAVAIPLVPCPDVRERTQPVDARVRPEVDGDDTPAQPLGRQRVGVEPDGRAVERRERAVDRVRDGHLVLLILQSPPTIAQRSCAMPPPYENIRS